MGLIERVRLRGENKRQQQEILAISDKPSVDTFSSYGLFIKTHSVPAENDTPRLIGEMHFIPFGNKRNKRLHAIAAGIEGMRRYFQHIDTEETNGNHITPELLVGITNFHMAKAAEALGFTIVPINLGPLDR